jgi:protein KRI1
VEPSAVVVALLTIAVEEKYGKNPDDDSEDSEEGVEEDDEAELLDEDLDDEVNATLQALRAKDPRIYNKEAKFYQDVETDEEDVETDAPKKEQSMTLRQYHTKNLLEGKDTGEDEDDAPPMTYAQEQEEVRQTLIKQAHAAEEEDEDDDFLVAKSKPAPAKKRTITTDDVEQADKDPETFLSNYMASRAWVPSTSSRFQPLESDDDSEEAAADEWENSYNMYFEDTAGANEKITTYARDAVASTSVRRDDATGRRKIREAARAKREAERQQKEQELARLRKLKVDEMEYKVNQIRQIGGLSGKGFKVEDWKDVLEADWSDEQWDKEMQKRFGDDYYNEGDEGSGSDDGGRAKSKKAKKPKFDDDLDIQDLVPDFKDEDEQASSNEDAQSGAEDEENEDAASKPAKSTKKRKQERADAKSAARRDRRIIENLVDSNLEYEAKLASKSKAPARFRYRETSPTTFGLTPRDILMADDTALNEFVGLKKLATFRDPYKKQKDKKLLGKKYRLRQWRQETFGDMNGPSFDGAVGTGANVDAANDAGFENIVEGEGKKKKKRSRKRKGGAVEA